MSTPTGAACAAGVEISLSMLQQQAFQSLELLRPYPSYCRQVEPDPLAWLFRARWDFITSSRPWVSTSPIWGLLPACRTHGTLSEVAERYGAGSCSPLMSSGAPETGGAGVCRWGNYGSRSSGKPDPFTVMCYSVSEPNAPVYGNVNQCFILECGKRGGPSP